MPTNNSYGIDIIGRMSDLLSAASETHSVAICNKTFAPPLISHPD